ncbi:MAG: Tad domain-containing protein [Acidobacteria bacterium]|nr:Tad domain-containing protein [Acidobacteriota bacterium]
MKMFSRLSSERGAILIHVGLASVVLIAFSMFVIDHGVMWVSRGQAQNAADSGALAGAIALAFDSFSDRADDGPAKQAALQFARANKVFGEDPDVNVGTDVIFYNPGNAAKFPAECADDSCVRVDVYRTNRDGRANPLPTMFGRLVGLTEQGVRAMAIARAAPANASDSLKPWAVADKWLEGDGTPLATTDAFEPMAMPPDQYTPPDEDDPGTGFTLSTDYGTELALTIGVEGDVIRPGWVQPIDLGGDFVENITGSPPSTWQIGDEPGKLTGSWSNQSRAAAAALMSLDSGADWDPVSRRVIGSNFEFSPRIVALPVFDLDYFVGTGRVRIVNILGFFVDRLVGSAIIGYLVSKPDLLVADGESVADEASFLKNVSLIR